MIAGERVTLRPLEPADVEPLNAIIAEPEVRRWWGTDPTVDDQDAFTIVVGGEIAGWLGWYEETDPDYRHGGLDIFLAPRFHGQGLGREALWLGAQLADHREGPPPDHHRPGRGQRARDRDLRVDRVQAGRASCARYERGPEGDWHDGLLMDLLAEELEPQMSSRPWPSAQATRSPSWASAMCVW